LHAAVCAHNAHINAHLSLCASLQHQLTLSVALILALAAAAAGVRESSPSKSSWRSSGMLLQLAGAASVRHQTGAHQAL
jgi:hypothetical protein